MQRLRRKPKPKLPLRLNSNNEINIRPHLTHFGQVGAKQKVGDVVNNPNNDRQIERSIDNLLSIIKELQTERNQLFEKLESYAGGRSDHSLAQGVASGGFESPRPGSIRGEEYHLTRRAVGFDSYYSGQAQHLIDWEYRQLKKQGKISYMDVSSEDIKQLDRPFYLKVWDKVRSFLNRPTVQVLIFLAVTGRFMRE